MITLVQYFRGKPHPPEHEANAVELLEIVNSLLQEMAALKLYNFDVDPDTGSQISGSKGGTGDGGYRSPDSSTGASTSSHKEGKGIDIYDPKGEVDKFCTVKMLTIYGLYREDSTKTPGWCHLTTRPPKSGKRVFLP